MKKKLNIIFSLIVVVMLFVTGCGNSKTTVSYLPEMQGESKGGTTWTKRQCIS